MVYKYITQQTQNISITFVQCWPNVFDAGPTLYKCYTNVLCSWGNHLPGHLAVNCCGHSQHTVSDNIMEIPAAKVLKPLTFNPSAAKRDCSRFF